MLQCDMLVSHDQTAFYLLCLVGDAYLWTKEILCMGKRTKAAQDLQLLSIAIEMMDCYIQDVLYAWGTCIHKDRVYLCTIFVT